MFNQHKPYPEPPAGWSANQWHTSPLFQTASDLRDTLSNLTGPHSRTLSDENLYRWLEIDKFAVAFADAFNIDLRSLPEDVSKLLLYIAITNQVPQYGVNRAFPDDRQAIYMNKVVMGVTFLQIGQEQLGVATLQTVVDELKLHSHL